MSNKPIISNKPKMFNNPKFYRVKCGEWRYPGKNLNQLKENMELLKNKVLKKVQDGDIIYIEYLDKQIPNIWNSFRIYYDKKLFSIGGNPGLSAGGLGAGLRPALL